MATSIRSRQSVHLCDSAIGRCLAAMSFDKATAVPLTDGKKGSSTATVLRDAALCTVSQLHSLRAAYQDRLTALSKPAGKQL